MDKEKTIKVARVITILHLIEGGNQGQLNLINCPEIKKNLAQLAEKGFIERKKGALKLKTKGKKLLDNLSFKQRQRFKRFFFAHQKTP